MEGEEKEGNAEKTESENPPVDGLFASALLLVGGGEEGLFAPAPAKEEATLLMSVFPGPKAPNIPNPLPIPLSKVPLCAPFPFTPPPFTPLACCC